MALNSELILTLQNVKGIGAKSVLEIAELFGDRVQDIDDLCQYWGTLKKKKYEKVTTDDLADAHRIALKIIDQSEDNHIGIISYYDSIFPQLLRDCIDEEGKAAPPVLLFYRGNIKALEKPGVAVIGTREPTSNGVKAGIYFSRELAKKGFNIVSGLAIGCDTTGHQGALEAGGITTAFLANGLDWESIYPKENLQLAKAIVENNGLLLSEYPIGQTCNRYALVARDRLQAGLSYATVAIQTGVNGGTMHAVKATLAAQKPLFMVNYKNEVDLREDKVQGNIEYIKSQKAHPLGTSTLESSIAIIEKEIEMRNKRRTLF